MTTVAKVIEVSSASKKGFDDAVQGGLNKVATNVKHIRGAWIKEIKVCTSEDGKITEWRVDMKVSFVVS